MADATHQQKMTEPLALGQFPILVRGLTERRTVWLAKAIEDINAGLASQAIPNPVFKEAKDALSRVVNDAFDRHVNEPFFYAGRYAEQPQAVQDLHHSFMISGLHDCKSAAKKIRATKATGAAVEAMKQFIDEVEPLVQAIESLKAMVVKRAVLSPEEREAKERFVPPMSSSGAVEAMQKILQGVTERHYKALVDHFCKQLHGNVVRFQQADKNGRAAIIRNPSTRAGVYEAGDLSLDRGKYEYTLFPDFEKTLLKMAEKEAQEIQDAFVNKNLRKLCSIVEKKGDFDRAEEVGSGVSLSGFEGAIRVHFKDGAHFTANNSVVWSTSVHGKDFRRFPLTFHDVIFPNGDRLPKPSEERMNDIFAVSGVDAVAEGGHPAATKSGGPAAP